MLNEELDEEFMLLPYQQRFVEDKSQFRVGAKSRRIGLTWATAAECVLAAADAGGCSVKYTSYKLSFTKDFIQTCAAWAEHFQCAYEERFLDDNGKVVSASPEAFVEKGAQLVYELRFPSGFTIQGVSSKPNNLRGGAHDRLAIIDEAAHIADLSEVLKACAAYVMWGGRVVIISTHNGVDNDFNKLCKDIKAGERSKRSPVEVTAHGTTRYAEEEHADSGVVYRNGQFALHTTCVHRALGEELFRRICLRSREAYSLEYERETLAAWLEGPGAKEELLCIPGKSEGAYLPPELIATCVDSSLPVVRLIAGEHAVFSIPETPDNPAVRKTILGQWAERRRRWASEWLALHIKPLLDALPNLPSYPGIDFGRVSDLSVCAPGQLQQNLTLKFPFLVELHGVPFSEQRQIWGFVLDGLPRMSGAAIDKGGNGADLAEAMQYRFGGVRSDGQPGIVEELSLSDAFYAQTFPALKSEMEAGRVVIPADLDVVADLRAVEVINGTPRVPKRRAKSATTKGVKRHGDAAIAIDLAAYKARTTDPIGDFSYQSSESEMERGRRRSKVRRRGVFM